MPCFSYSCGQRSASADTKDLRNDASHGLGMSFVVSAMQLSQEGGGFRGLS